MLDLLNNNWRESRRHWWGANHICLFLCSFTVQCSMAVPQPDAFMCEPNTPEMYICLEGRRIESCVGCLLFCTASARKGTRVKWKQRKRCSTLPCAPWVSDVDEEQGAAGHGHYHCVEVRIHNGEGGDPFRAKRAPDGKETPTCYAAACALMPTFRVTFGG